jgi:hypothetical protein
VVCLRVYAGFPAKEICAGCGGRWWVRGADEGGGGVGGEGSGCAVIMEVEVVVVVGKKSHGDDCADTCVQPLHGRAELAPETVANVPNAAKTVKERFREHRERKGGRGGGREREPPIARERETEQASEQASEK